MRFSPTDPSWWFKRSLERISSSAGPAERSWEQKTRHISLQRRFSAPPQTCCVCWEAALFGIFVHCMKETICVLSWLTFLQPPAPGGSKEGIHDTFEMVGVNLEPPAVTAATV